MTLTQTEQERLAQIRASLEIHEAMGFDTSTWEASFFLKILAKSRGIIPVFFMFAIAIGCALALTVDYRIQHIETKAERHQRQVEFR